MLLDSHFDDLLSLIMAIRVETTQQQHQQETD